MGKNLPAMQEMQESRVGSLELEDPLEDRKKVGKNIKDKKKRQKREGRSSVPGRES